MTDNLIQLRDPKDALSAFKVIKERFKEEFLPLSVGIDSLREDGTFPRQSIVYEGKPCTVEEENRLRTGNPNWKVSSLRSYKGYDK